MKINEIIVEQDEKRKRYLAGQQRVILRHLEDDIHMALRRLRDIGFSEDDAADVVWEFVQHMDMGE